VTFVSFTSVIAAGVIVVWYPGIVKPDGRVVLILGTEPADVTKTPEAEVARPLKVVPAAA
jgi:hypothetical protein